MIKRIYNSKETKVFKNEIGITLIALVITIIVLLILASVSIATLTGDNGILGKAIEAKENSNKAKEKEIFKLMVSEYNLRKDTGDFKENVSIKPFLEECVSKGTIKSFETVTVVDDNNDDSDEKYNYKDAGKYVVTIENEKFVFPYIEEIKKVDSPNETGVSFTQTANGENAQSYYENNGKYPVRLSPFTSFEEKNGYAQYAIFYKKLANESDDKYVQTKVERGVIVKEEGYIFNLLGSSGEDVYFTELDLDTEYTLKIECIFENGARTSTTFTTPKVCFVAGTKVLTENGLINIEEIKEGMKVYSKNMETGEIQIKKVLSAGGKILDTNSGINNYKIYIGNETIESTQSHPYYEKNKGFVSASQLEVGDILINVEGKEVLIDKIEIIENKEQIMVYNMNVEDNHNYFVGQNNILVHNAGCPT